ncbi:ATP-binding protein [Cupriavidus sp. LEh21]|nr:MULTISPECIES: ATP-binding protein [unclassified Cupriavidus]MDK2660717.1 ATP-binding protein [Cupriavidus sp. LEh21]
MGRVVYLTGAPATGKTTVCDSLVGTNRNLTVHSYSRLLRAHIEARAGKVLATADIRAQSGTVVTRSDVAEVDHQLLQLVERDRQTGDVIIDSHPVTKESYGFRVTPFVPDHLKALAIDSIVCLYAPAEVLRQRIMAAPEGRPLPSDYELSMHVQTQASLAAQYAVLAGCACHLVDSSGSPEELLARLTPIFRFNV